MISSSDFVPQHQLPLSYAPEKIILRRPRSAEYASDPVVPANDTGSGAQAKGDSQLAGIFAQALRSAASTGRLDDIDNIPADSTFGQWWSHLQNAMKSPCFVDWATTQGIDLTKSIEINPRENLIAAMVGGQRKTFSGAQLGHLWTSMMAPIMQAAKALTSGSAYLYSPTSSTSAPYRAVADFYGEALSGQTRESAAARAAEFEQTNAFKAKWPAPELSEEALQSQQANLANADDRRSFATALLPIAQEVDALSETLMRRTKLDPLDQLDLPPERVPVLLEQLIRRELSSVNITLSPDPTLQPLREGATVSLEQYLNDIGWNVPTGRDELFNLGRMLYAPPLSQLPLGDFGGALSWPTPLSDEDRRDMRDALSQNTLGIDDLHSYDEGKGVLGYLTRNQQFEPYELRDPARFIQTLLSTSKAQALGQALQEKFNGISTPESINDWTLGALSATLDRAFDSGSTSAPARTVVADFGLARSAHWGLPTSTVVAGLTKHLFVTGRASLELAPIAAHLLLSRRAPAFLVKDIPDKVTYGSHSWVSFSTAVARLESQAPGSTAHMNYAHVMQRADVAPVTEQERQVERTAQQDALKDWGVANGVIQLNTLDEYADDEMSRVFKEFNAQVSALSEASQAYSTPMPVRKEMALKELKHVYGDKMLLEDKCITLVPQNRDFPGPYSVLDLYMDGKISSPQGGDWSSSNDDINIRSIQGNAYQLPDINKRFNTELPKYFSSAQSATGTQVKHLIATLPVQDRKTIEQAKITTLRESRVTKGAFSSELTETEVPHCLLVKTELAGVVNVYEINLKENSIRKRDELEKHPLAPEYAASGPSNGNVLLKEVTPSGSYPSDVTDEKIQSGTPNSFSSEKTRYIADAMTEVVGIRKLEAEAKGVTTFDTEVPFYKKAREFMLNLIPLRSAIQNFQAGNIGDGIVDLTFDAFGFVLGLHAAAKGAKALQTGASALSKVTHGGKILGRAAISSLNPLDGTGSVLISLANVGKKSATHTYRLLRGTNSYDLIQASKQFDASAMGTFKLQGSIVEGPAVLSKGKWYAFDALSGGPFGKALDDFQPSFRSSELPLGKWATSVPTPTPEAIALRNRWSEVVKQHKTAADPTDFQLGYSKGDPKSIAGYRSDMKSEEVMKLATTQPLTPAQIGTLVRQEERLAVQHGFKGVSRFYESISDVGGHLTPAPQVFYLSQTRPFSRGQCAAMSRLMANAMEQGTEAKFIGNLFTAAANPADTASRQFIEQLGTLQKQVEGPALFHAGRPRRQMGYKDIIAELAGAKEPKTLMISTRDHAMTVGVVGEGLNKKFFFYDPNFGLATFTSPEMMKRGLDKVFTDKKLPVQYTTHSKDPNTLEFEVSVHDNSWKRTNGVADKTVKDLSEVPLVIKSPVITNTPVPTKPVTPVNPTAAVKAEKVEVLMGQSHTVTDQTSLLSTNSLSDCSAVVVLSDLKDGIYQKRSLVHLTGSNLAQPINGAKDGFAWLQGVKKDLENGGKIIFVGGVDTRSVVGVAAVIGQQDLHKQQPFLELLQRNDVSVTYASSVGVDVAPDGTFKLRNDNGAGVFDARKVRDILDFAKD